MINKFSGVEKTTISFRDHDILLIWLVYVMLQMKVPLISLENLWIPTYMREQLTNELFKVVYWYAGFKFFREGFLYKAYSILIDW